jgi:transposase
MADADVVYVGIDWATEFHDALAMDQGGRTLGVLRVQHSGAGLEELVGWLNGFGVAPDRVHLAIEVPHGAIVETLLERGFAVYSINPKQLDRFRDRFSLAGAKDDRRDCLVLADSLRTDGHLFRRIQTDPARIIELREHSRMWDDLAADRLRLANQMREQLWRYFPQYLQLGDDFGAPWLLDLWELIPTPQEALRRRPGALARILRKNRIRRLSANQVIEVLRQPPLTVAPGTVDATTAHIRFLLPRLRLLNEQMKQVKRRLESLLQELSAPTPIEDGKPDPTEAESLGEHRDAEILLSNPGIGTIVGATMLAEATEPLRRRDYHALRAVCGAAPVTKRSGKGRPLVVMRQACNHRLRNAIYHMARTAVQQDSTCKARYAALRARGHGHARALRSIADRLLYVLVAMLRTKTLYRVPVPT